MHRMLQQEREVNKPNLLGSKPKVMLARRSGIFGCLDSGSLAC